LVPGSVAAFFQVSAQRPPETTATARVGRAKEAAGTVRTTAAAPKRPASWTVSQGRRRPDRLTV